MIRSIRWAGWLTLGLCLGACAKNKASDRALATHAPGAEAEAARDYSAEEGAPVVEDGFGKGGELDDLEQQLAAREASLTEIGVELDADLAKPEAAPSEVGVAATSQPEGPDDRCERICDIAEAVCELETKICGLAERHEGDSRYATTCRRAQSDCERATRACDDCG